MITVVTLEWDKMRNLADIVELVYQCHKFINELSFEVSNFKIIIRARVWRMVWRTNRQDFAPPVGRDKYTVQTFQLYERYGLIAKINVHILLTFKLPAAFQASLKIGSSREFFNCTHSSSAHNYSYLFVETTLSSSRANASRVIQFMDI